MKSQRAWHDPRGYRFLFPWSNAVLLEILIRKFTSTLVPPSPPLHSYNIPIYSSNPREYRLKAQLDDAARSIVSNIVEGFKRPTTKEYLEFLGFSQASLEEVRSDVSRSLQNGLLKSVKGTSLAGIGIDLKAWNEWCRDPKNEGRLLDFKLKESYRNLKEFKGENIPSSNIPPSPSSPSYNTPLNSSKIPLTPSSFLTLRSLPPSALTYEIFIELINKTDYLLRNLVVSLQKSGDLHEELLKDPHRAEEIENEKYVDELLKKTGVKNLRNPVR